jgi:hypothetical protein
MVKDGHGTALVLGRISVLGSHGQDSRVLVTDSNRGVVEAFRTKEEAGFLLDATVSNNNPGVFQKDQQFKDSLEDAQVELVPLSLMETAQFLHDFRRLLSRVPFIAQDPTVTYRQIDNTEVQ